MITFAKGPDGDRVHVDDTKSRVEYTCFVCGAPLVPNKGDVYRHHFKHKGGRACTDTWHGTYCDTEWHSSWQERYPQKNRERVLELGSTRHRADVVVGETVIEFQHSTLSKAQFDDRNAFYGDLGHKVVWLFDLREAYAKGEIVPRHSEDAGPGMLPTSFVWHNPKQAFNAYDPLRGDVDLLFQLSDDNGGKCIVRVEESCDAGFEEFRVSTWLTAQEFLAHTGLDAKGCPEPNLAPLEPNSDYVRFRERYDVRLNPQQERSAQVVDGSTLLLAVPGSGKTTTMVARLGYLTVERHVDPKSVIALTYGRDAANEMRTRFARQFRDQALANAITFSTINAFCLKIYHEWCDKSPARRAKQRELIQENDARKLLRGLYREATGKFVSEAMLIGLATTINWLKNSMLEPDDLPWLDEEIPHFTDAYKKYCQRLKEDRKMDFDDQLRFAKYALEHDEELLEEYRSRYRYWCVDEAQDTSRIQHHVIRMLAGAEGSGNVFMVGDEDQSIYGYRGAYPQALLSFPFDYPNARTLRMETNYRSGDEIVSAARTFIGGCKGRIEKRMVSGRGPGSVVRVEEVGCRLDQFDAALALIRNHQREGRGTLAVLYRNNETAIPLVDQLIREGVAFTLSGNADTLFTSPTVRDVKAFMRLALDPRDKDSLSHVYMKAQCYIKKKDYEWACRRSRRDGIDLLQGLVDGMSSHPNKRRARLGRQNAQRFSTLVRTIAGLTPREAIEHLLENGYGEWLEDQGKSSRTIDLLKPIAGREQSIRSFLDRLDFLSTSFDKKRPNHLVSGALTLATTHSCKGREFDRVVIVDAIDGIFPSSRRDPLDYGKDEARNWQEERRLFYVAMTRAKDELVLMRPADEATPFVDEVFPRPVPAPDLEAPASNATPSLPAAGAPVPDATILRRDGQVHFPVPSPDALPIPVPDSELPSTLNTPSSALTPETHLSHSSEPKTPPAQGPSQSVLNSEALSSPVFIPKPAPDVAPIPRETCVPNLPTPAPTHEAERTLDVPPSAPIPSPGVSSGCRGEAKIGGTSIIQETLGTDSVPAQGKVSRYDVDTWEVLEDRGPSFRRVACGGTFAEVTSGIAGKTLDLMAPWTEDQVRDLTDHLGEYAHGRTEVAVHFDVTGTQRMRDVRPHVVGVNRIALRLEDDSLFEALSRLIRELEKLEASSAILLLDCLVPNGPSGERRVLDVDDKSRCVLVSADLYDE